MWVSPSYAGKCFVWFWPLMKTPISRYLTLLSCSPDLTFYWLHWPDIGLCLRCPETRDRERELEMSRVGGREGSNNAFSAETGHKFSRSSTRHDFVKPVGREDERFHLTRIPLYSSICNMNRLNYFCPRCVGTRLWPRSGPGSYNYKTCHPDPDILSPTDQHTLKQKLHPDPFIIIVLWLCSWWHNFQVESRSQHNSFLFR